jgi:hypothetical protein
LDQNPHLVTNAQATARINGALTADSGNWWGCVGGTVGNMVTEAIAGVGVGCGTGAIIGGVQGCAVGIGIGGVAGVVGGGLSGIADHC